MCIIYALCACLWDRKQIHVIIRVVNSYDVEVNVACELWFNLRHNPGISGFYFN